MTKVNVFGAIGTAALKKFGKVPAHFVIYEVGIIGDVRTSDTFEVKGCVMRQALKGKNKGEFCIVVPGSKRVVHVVRSEIGKRK